MLDYSEDLPPDLPAPKPKGQGRFMAAGVVSALALGVGMGLWARPAPPETPHPTTMAPEDAPRPALQIVVDDNPAPLGPLLEVLPGEASEFRDAPPPAEIVVPHRAAAGLMKVDAIVAAEPSLLVQTVKVEPRPKPELQIEAAPEKVQKPKVQKAKAEPKPKPETLKVAEAKAKKAEKAKIETARLEKARLEKAKADKAEKAQLAKAEKARTEKLAKAKRAEAVKLAQADAKREKGAKAKAETRRLAALVKAAPKALKAEVAKKKIQLAQAKPAKKVVATKPKVEKASTRPVIAKAPVRKPPPRKVVPVGEGPMRVARNDACASSDPGQAVVCADRRLGARDRQLQQAYRNAEAAGVPASSLQRQQARWLQARAAAAREAPWAVEDVYEARISELNDLTRDAREN
jgi:hypothetical protein